MVAPPSVDENAKVASPVPTVPVGPWFGSIVTGGGVVSMVKEVEAGLWSMSPFALTARTWIVWLPCPVPAKDFGEVQVE